MKKIVIVNGLISGLIVTAMMVIGTSMLYSNPDFEGSMILGYAGMIAAFSLIFVGIKMFRDKYNNGVISFGKAFKIGFFISLIASSIYVAVWMIEYYFFIPDFMEKYTEYTIQKTQASGAAPAEMEKQMEEMAGYKEMYKNPIFIILLTYMEILPIGVVVSLIASLILKKKEKAIA